ncbi:MAG: patatin-like phospholipase family protein [Bacteroidales bacterium]|nr:patatin-like phospholipase family protein [Bacteroidales bacterium]
MKRLILTILSFLALSVASIYADDGFPNGLTIGSVNPSVDSVALGQIRAHLDEVRSRENRPTVALVLCGGGAKGAAEVGAMRLIEEMEIPIDFVCGTSIGGLLGGLYSVGYRVDFLDSMFRSQDWEKMLSDKIPSSSLPLARKKYNAKYQLSIPFHYDKDVIRMREAQQEIYTERDGKLHLRDAASNLDTQMGFSPLLSSLPSGYVYGLHINNMFSSLTVGYQDSLSFSKLPIPFSCVATELVSRTAKNWSSGELKTAMRSSMGIPVLFTPVRTDGMVLTDGGTRNNFPADIARAVGADIVIGIDLTDPMPAFSKVNNVGTILGQFVGMLVSASHDDLVKMTDVYIRPKLDGFTSLSFKPEAVDSLIANGYREALLHKDELAAVKERTGNAKTVYYGKKAVDINKKGVRLSSVEFEGMTDRESLVLQKTIKLDVRKEVTAEMLEEAIAMIQGSGAVESVTYSLLGSEEPYRLVFSCAKAPTNRIGIGARLDTEVWAEVGLNFGWNMNKIAGPKLNLSAKIGKSQSIDARFMVDYPRFPTLNVEVTGSNINSNYNVMPDIDLDSKVEYNMGFLMHQEKVFLSYAKWMNFDGQIGFRMMGMKMNENKLGTTILFMDEVLNETFAGGFINGNYYTMDNMYCPTKGVDLKFSATADFLKFNAKSFTPIYSFSFDVKGVIPLGNRVALIPDFHLRHFLNSDDNSIREYNPETGKFKINDNYSTFHHNFIGGDIPGRYIEHQVPFIGFNNLMNCYQYYFGDKNGTITERHNDHLAVLNLDLRVNVIKNLYVSAMGGYIHLAPTFKEFITYDGHYDIFGSALQLTYNTILGPIKARFQWADRQHEFKRDWGFYLSVGFDL